MLPSSEAILPLTIAGVLLVVAAWVSWRKPTLLLIVALASLALRPQLLWGGPAVGYEWGLSQTLLMLALVVNGLRYGVRRAVPWPIVALLAAFVLGLLLGDLHQKLTVPLMVMALALLMLPFAFTQVVLEPGARRILALTIALTPALSVALGAVLQLAEVRPLFNPVMRLEGALGNSAVFAVLAFGGFAVALHELTRPGRPYALPLAVVNLTFVILSGTRMAIVAAAILLIAYVALSARLRDLARAHRVVAAGAAVAVAAVLVWYWPSLAYRMFGGGDLQTVGVGDAAVTMNLSNRGDIWQFYFQEFLLSPMFGRGMGAGLIAATDWVPWPRKTPHNEYLHLLVDTGVVGFALCAAGIVLWYRQLLGLASHNDRSLLWALIPALGVFAFFEDVVAFSTGLALFAYLGVLLTKPAIVVAAAARRPRQRRPRLAREPDAPRA